MKKILIIVGIVALVAGVDIAIRLLWPTTPEQPAPLVDTPPPIAKAVDGDQDRSGWQDEGKRGVKSRMKMEPIRDRRACETVGDLVLRKKGRGLTLKDLEPVRALSEPNSREPVEAMLFHYFTCRSLEDNSYSFCEDEEKLNVQSKVRCWEIYAVNRALIAYHFTKLDEQQANAEVVGWPEKAQKAYLATYYGAKNRDPSACPNLGLTEAGLACCQIGIMVPSPPPSPDEEAMDLHRAYMALSTGQKAGLQNISEPFTKVIISTMMGETGHCDTLLTKEIEAICKHL